MSNRSLFLLVEGMIVLLLCLIIYLTQTEFNHLSGVALVVAISQLALFVSYWLMYKEK